MSDIGDMRIRKPIEAAITEIRRWLDKISVSRLAIQTAYDARQNIAILKFNHKGKTYEFKSTKQDNARLNMWGIARVMEYKVRAHLMRIEEFETSMKAYLALEAPPDYPEQPLQENADAPVQDYAALGVSPLASNEELESAFKKAAKTWHPDMAGSSEAKIVFEAKFAEITAVWQRIKKVRMIP